MHFSVPVIIHAPFFHPNEKMIPLFLYLRFFNLLASKLHVSRNVVLKGDDSTSCHAVPNFLAASISSRRGRWKRNFFQSEE